MIKGTLSESGLFEAEPLAVAKSLISLGFVVRWDCSGVMK